MILHRVPLNVGGGWFLGVVLLFFLGTTDHLSVISHVIWIVHAGRIPRLTGCFRAACSSAQIRLGQVLFVGVFVRELRMRGPHFDLISAEVLIGITLICDGVSVDNRWVFTPFGRTLFDGHIALMGRRLIYGCISLHGCLLNHIVVLDGPKVEKRLLFYCLGGRVWISFWPA